MSDLALQTGTIGFLQKLAANNNREWFQANKELYNMAKADFENFVSQLIQAFDHELGLKNVQAKSCIYRIYKDVRFSKDGTLYKNEFGATIAADGKKTTKAALHLYIKHDQQVFVDIGTCHMSPKDLAHVRSAIDYDASDLEAFLESIDFKETFAGKLIGDQLKSAPRGYSVDHKNIELLRYKNFSIRSVMKFEDLTSSEAEQQIRNIVKAAAPFRNYLNKALEFSEQ